MDLDALHALADAATPGPWEWDTEGEILSSNGTRFMFAVWLDVDPADAAFIAAARTTVPDLIDALDAETRRADLLRHAALTWMEYGQNRLADAHEMKAERDAARAERDALREQIAAVRALHRNQGSKADPRCAVCCDYTEPVRQSHYPCATIRALDTP
jgi:hypothetical protein